MTLEVKRSNLKFLIEFVSARPAAEKKLSNYELLNRLIVRLDSIRNGLQKGFDEDHVRLSQAFKKNLTLNGATLFLKSDQEIARLVALVVETHFEEISRHYFLYSKPILKGKRPEEMLFLYFSPLQKRPVICCREEVSTLALGASLKMSRRPDAIFIKTLQNQYGQVKCPISFSAKTGLVVDFKPLDQIQKLERDSYLLNRKEADPDEGVYNPFEEEPSLPKKASVEMNELSVKSMPEPVDKQWDDNSLLSKST